jgi:hypothetical protein
MQNLLKDDTLYKVFLGNLPENIVITEEQKKNVFDLFVKIAYVYFMEQE